MSRSRLLVIAAVSLVATVLLGFAVSRGHDAHRLEWQAIHLLGRRPSASWASLAGVLAVPAIAAVLVVSTAIGAVQHVLLRVAVCAGLAALAFVISEHLVKPLVGQRFHGALSFPSGNVTAVCATALAMWIALYPVLGRWARTVALACGAAWTLLMSLAVVGAFWHTPLDAIGSVLLSVGIVTGGAAFLEPKDTPAPPLGAERDRVPAGV